MLFNSLWVVLIGWNRASEIAQHVKIQGREKSPKRRLGGWTDLN